MEDNFQSGDSTTLEGLQNVISKQEEEIDSLKNRIDELSTNSKCASATQLECKHPALEELQNTVTKQEIEIIDLKTELDKLNCKLKEKENSLLVIGGKNSSQKIIQDLEDTTKDLKYENKCLRACLLPISPQADNAALLEIEVKNNEKLQKEVAELNKKLENQNFWKIENSEVHQELRRQYNVLEAKNDEQQYMIKSLLESEKRLRSVENELSVLHGKYQQTLHKNNILQSEMEIQIQQYKDMVKETENENFLLKEKLREAKSIYNVNAADKIVNLEEKVTQLNAEKNILEGKLATDKEKLGSILGRLEQSIKYHKKQKIDLHAEIDQLNLRICELQGNNSSLEASLNERNQMMEGVTNNKIIQLQNEIALYKTDKMLLQERLNAFNSQHDDIVSQIKGCAMKQVETETEIIQLQAHLNKEMHAKNQIEYQLTESKEYVSELKNNMKQRTAILEKEMHQFKAKNIVLEKERDLVVCENNELTLRIADLQKNASRLHTTCAKLDAINKENNGLRSELEIMKKQFQGKITNARIIIQQLKSENSSLKTQINDLIKTMKVEDNIDLLVQDRLIEKKGLHEKIQKLETRYQELEVKYNKCKDEFGKQSKYYKDQMEDLLIEKNTEIQNLKDDNNQNLTLAKIQYDKDIQFIHGRHNEAINKLQTMHEENIKEKVVEHETEIEDLRAQKQAYRDALRKIRREVEELRDQLTIQQKEHNSKIEDMKQMFEADRKRSTENIARLAKKCWIELEKIQVINKENQYIQQRAEKEILLARKRSEIREIEDKLNNIKINKTVETNQNNTETIDGTETSRSLSTSCFNEKTSNNSNEKQSGSREIERSLENTINSDLSYENDKSTVYMIKNIEKTSSTEKDGSEIVSYLNDSSYITMSSDSFSNP